MTDTQIKLLLLDFDGTLADTRRANTLAYVATLREAGYPLTEEEYAAAYFGMRCNEFLTRYGIANPAERERLRLRKIALYPTFFDTVHLNLPLWNFCQQFRAQGGRVWIVSTGSRANLENAMRYLGIGIADHSAAQSICRPENHAENSAFGPHVQTHGGVLHGTPNTIRDLQGETQGKVHPIANTQPDAENATFGQHNKALNGEVDGLISGADVVNSKPAPDCFLEVMRREGCTPREALIFEDSPIGLEAARRSGAGYFKVEL